MAAMDIDREPIDAPTGITELPAPAQRRDVQQPAGPRRWLSAEDVQVRSLSARSVFLCGSVVNSVFLFRTGPLQL